jgi:hypothetical protein
MENGEDRNTSSIQNEGVFMTSKCAHKEAWLHWYRNSAVEYKVLLTNSALEYELVLPNSVLEYGLLGTGSLPKSLCVSSGGNSN